MRIKKISRQLPNKIMLIKKHRAQKLAQKVNVKAAKAEMQRSKTTQPQLQPKKRLLKLSRPKNLQDHYLI